MLRESTSADSAGSESPPPIVRHSVPGSDPASPADPPGPEDGPEDGPGAGLEDGGEPIELAPDLAASLVRELETSYTALCQRVRSRLGSAERSGLDPEDIVQETLLAAWASLGAFEVRGEVRSSDKTRERGDASGSGFAFGAWLRRIADTKTLDAVRRARLVRRADLDEETCEAASGPPAIDRLELAEVAGSIYAALHRLTPDQRTVIMLKDVFGLPWESVADLLGRGVGACQALRTRACRELARLQGRT